MYTSVVLLFSLIGIIHCDNPQDLKMIYSARATPNDVNSLAELKSDEILPLLLFDQKKSDKDYQVPLGLSIAAVKDGRFMSGTLFHTVPKRKQIFFCPWGNRADRCLLPKSFDEPIPLRCADEMLPVIEKDSRDKKCGQFENGTRYRFQYNICKEAKEFGYELSEVIIYQFCYDKEPEKNLFTVHTIASPLLLAEKLLKREHEIEFDVAHETYGSIDTDLGIKKMINSETSQYSLQQIVPSEDMALASWRRPTYHYLNYELQHVKFFDLWNEINGYIRTHAIQLYAFKVIIYTGVFEIPITKESQPAPEDKQKYNFWVKLITDKASAPSKAIAILMNNFISIDDKNPPQVDGNQLKADEKQLKADDNQHQVDNNQLKTDENQSKAVKSKDKYIDRFCKKNLCLDHLIQKFNRAGGRILCCEATPEILQLFGMSITIPQVLPIYDINLE